ncbi:hypothetical protein J5N97_018581 [Dioscorea zingiberensis]|uniref:Protein AATF n=1 Tax=Dioscorea zingiberensis TaxID=325984 RepID=A0A9D5HBU6_9LILI|nr:hypothetical protein J5N97_018581 [Dioscorea zingiberensis]
MEDGEEEVGGDEQQNAEMEELERQYQHLRHEEQDHLKNLKRHKDEDALKGLAIKNQKALWDKTLEFRFLLQKVFASSNKLPQESVRSSFCISSTEVDQTYSDLILSSKQTLNCMLELQEALVERNPSVIQDVESRKGSGKDEVSSNDIGGDGDEDWLQIHKMHSRIASFRNISVDKWQRKTQVTTGAAAVKGKLQAFNQNISEQVAGYMRDPSKMIKRMQLRASSVGVFGKVPEDSDGTSKEDTNMDGDPELVDDSEFYQQLLKEFLESCDPTSSEVAFYALRKMQAKKRKIVDRRASKSRKIRVNDLTFSEIETSDEALPPQSQSDALVESIPSVIQDVESRNGSGKDEFSSNDIGGDGDEDWLQIHKMHSRNQFLVLDQGNFG